MTQKELIDKVHSGNTEKITLKELTCRLADEIRASGVNELRCFIRMLEPASYAYNRAYPEDLSDGPFDI